MKRLLLVRHGESESNAGMRTETPWDTPLTEKGHEQARALAASLDAAPGLIVWSPFLRAEQTAIPARARFRLSGREVWPVQEFTQLDPWKWKGTTHAEREALVKAHWDRENPRRVDPPDGQVPDLPASDWWKKAESLLDLFGRASRALDDAAQLPHDTILCFTHGHFVRAALWCVLGERRPDTAAKMRAFRAFAESFPVDNCSVTELIGRGSRWWAAGPRRASL